MPISPDTKARNLGVIFDSDLSLTARVNQLVGRCYGQLRSIRSCRTALNRSAAAVMVHSFIVSRLDYCNSLFAGSTSQNMNKLRRVLNYAARVVYGGRRSDNVTPILRDRLHWLRASGSESPTNFASWSTRRSTNQHRHIYRSCVRRLLSLFHVAACASRRICSYHVPSYSAGARFHALVRWHGMPCLPTRSSTSITEFKQKREIHIFGLSYTYTYTYTYT